MQPGLGAHVPQDLAVQIARACAALVTLATDEERRGAVHVAVRPTFEVLVNAFEIRVLSHVVGEALQVHSIHPRFIETSVLDDANGTDLGMTDLSRWPSRPIRGEGRVRRYSAGDNAAFTTGLALYRDGGTQAMVDRMQTRAELYATIGYHDYEALDASIVTTVIPEAMPQRA